LAFLKHHRPDLEAVELQGDAEAQLEAFANQGLDALVISAAALTHLGLRGRIAALLPSDLFLPAPGQGALGLVVRHDDDIAAEVAYSLQHRPSDDRTSAERAFLQGLAVPNPQTVAALATLGDDGGLLLEGCLLGAAGRMIRASTEGEADEAETLGFELAEELLKQGGQELLDTF
jgi:hydroxymethylbilane synthase